MQPHDVLICSSGQAALSTAFRALAAPGGAVLFEPPTYLGALAAARAAGLRIIPVPVDADGVRPDLLAAAFAQSGARLFYCQPLHANPHGAVLATDRRRAVLDAVAAAGAFLVEDDYARDLTIDGDPPPPLVATAAGRHRHSWARRVHPLADQTRGTRAARGRVSRLRPSGRPASRDPHGRRLLRCRPTSGNRAGTRCRPFLARHLRRVRKALRERRDTLVAAVRESLGAHSLPSVPTGGFHLWVTLPATIDDVALAEQALRSDVIVTAGRHWFPAEPPAPFLRLSYAGAEPTMFAQGVRRLAELMPATT